MGSAMSAVAVALAIGLAGFFGAVFGRKNDDREYSREVMRKGEEDARRAHEKEMGEAAIRAADQRLIEEAAASEKGREALWAKYCDLEQKFYARGAVVFSKNAQIGQLERVSKSLRRDLLVAREATHQLVAPVAAPQLAVRTVEPSSSPWGKLARARIGKLSAQLSFAREKAAKDLRQQQDLAFNLEKQLSSEREKAAKDLQQQKDLAFNLEQQLKAARQSPPTPSQGQVTADAIRADELTKQLAAERDGREADRSLFNAEYRKLEELSQRQSSADATNAAALSQRSAEEIAGLRHQLENYQVEARTTYGQLNQQIQQLQHQVVGQTAENERLTTALAEKQELLEEQTALKESSEFIVKFYQELLPPNGAADQPFDPSDVFDPSPIPDQPEASVQSTQPDPEQSTWESDAAVKTLLDSLAKSTQPTLKRSAMETEDDDPVQTQPAQPEPESSASEQHNPFAQPRPLDAIETSRMGRPMAPTRRRAQNDLSQQIASPNYAQSASSSTIPGHTTFPSQAQPAATQSGPTYSNPGPPASTPSRPSTFPLGYSQPSATQSGPSNSPASVNAQHQFPSYGTPSSSRSTFPPGYGPGMSSSSRTQPGFGFAPSQTTGGYNPHAAGPPLPANDAPRQATGGYYPTVDGAAAAPSPGPPAGPPPPPPAAAPSNSWADEDHDSGNESEER